MYNGCGVVIDFFLIVVGVSWPLPKVQKVRIDAVFLDPSYPRVRANMGMSPDEHPGVDINVSGTSGNADFGYPVVAMSEGKVIHVGNHRVWGNVVLVHHPTLRKFLRLDHEVYTQYAHLHQVCVSEGDWVYQGDPIGSIGKGDPLYPMFAHLHFEVRKSGPEIIPPDYWPRTKANIMKHYLDPVDFIKKYYKERTISFPKASIFSDGSVFHIDGQVLVNISNRNKAFIRKV